MRSFWIDFRHHCRKVLLWVLRPLRKTLISQSITLLSQRDYLDIPEGNPAIQGKYLGRVIG
jgi:hypothetical protein